jgi:integrase
MGFKPKSGISQQIPLTTRLNPMQHIDHYLYRDANGQLTFRLILPRLLQQRFPSVAREIRWPLPGTSEEDARALARDLANRIRLLRFRLGQIKTAESLLHELAEIRAGISPPQPQPKAPRPSVAHSSQLPCPVLDLSLSAGRPRFAQLQMTPTFLLRDREQFTVQAPLPDLLGAAYPLLLKTQVFELQTPDQKQAHTRAAFILQGLAELTQNVEAHLNRGEWLPLYLVTFQIEALRRYVMPDHGLNFLHNPQWLALRPQDLRERDREFLELVGRSADGVDSGHQLFPAVGGPHSLETAVPPLLRQHYPQLPERLPFNLYTSDLHEAVLKSGYVLERLDWLEDLVQQGERFGGGIPSLNELRIHVEAIRARLLLDDLPNPPTGQTPPVSPAPSSPANTPTPSRREDLAFANPLGALFATDFQARAERSASPMTVRELMERYRREQEMTGQWSHQGTRFLNCARLEAACELLGLSRPIDSVTTEDFRNLRTALLMYPRNRRQMRELNDIPIHTLLEQGGYEAVHPKTAKKYFDLVRSMFRFAFENEWITRDIAAPVQLKEKTRKKSSRQRRAYSHQELKTLLNGPLYTATTTPRWRMDNFKFWLPLLGLYTGSRLNELCQLTIDDIHQSPEGVWLMSHNLNHPHKLLKNGSSERDIPVHSVLIEKGFIDFVSLRRKEASSGRELLFPEMKADTRRAHSHIASRWFCGDPQRAGYLQQCGFPRRNGLTFHSLRHTFINQLRQAGVEQPRIQALTGHVNESTTADYGDGYNVRLLQETIECLKFSIDLSHISFDRYRQLQLVSYKPGRPRNSAARPAKIFIQPVQQPLQMPGEWL